MGHTGLTILRSDARACEAGNTIVDPAHRGQGLLALLAGALADLVREEGFVAYLHYPTTAHEIMQKASVRSGGVETGVMLDYIPAETDYRAIERTRGRLAATVVYQPFAAAPLRAVWVPEEYASTILALYRATHLERGLSVSRPGSGAQRTLATETRNTRRSLLRVEVARAGVDLGAYVHGAMMRAPAVITHVDLALDDPGVATAVNALTALGFCFCALLPEFVHTDVLRLQHLAAPTGLSFSPALVNPDAKRLLELMKARA